MRKIIFIFCLIIPITNLAYAGIITENTVKNCDYVSVSPVLSAIFELNEYTCSAGYYLPANHEGCEPCPTDHTCSGGTFTFDENNSQGISYNLTITTGYNYGCDQNVVWGFHTVFAPNEHDCSTGYYLPANVDECTICPANSYCGGGTYAFNETTDQGIVACASGSFSPAGASSVAQCGRKLHVGDDVVFLRSVKKTTPSLNFDIDQDGTPDFFGNMTTVRTLMNKDSTHYFHIQWDNNDYYLCDDTTCP